MFSSFFSPSHFLFERKHGDIGGSWFEAISGPGGAKETRKHHKKKRSKRKSLQRDHKTRSTSRLRRPRDQSSHATFIPLLFFLFSFFFFCPFLLSVDFIYFMHRQIPPLCSTAFGAGRAWKPPFLVSFYSFFFLSLLPALLLRLQVLAGISLSWAAGVWKVQPDAEQAIRSGRGADASGGWAEVRMDGWMDGWDVRMVHDREGEPIAVLRLSFTEQGNQGSVCAHRVYVLSEASEPEKSRKNLFHPKTAVDFKRRY